MPKHRKEKHNLVRLASKSSLFWECGGGCGVSCGVGTGGSNGNNDIHIVVLEDGCGLSDVCGGVGRLAWPWEMAQQPLCVTIGNTRPEHIQSINRWGWFSKSTQRMKSTIPSEISPTANFSDKPNLRPTYFDSDLFKTWISFGCVILGQTCVTGQRSTEQPFRCFDFTWFYSLICFLVQICWWISTWNLMGKRIQVGHLVLKIQPMQVAPPATWWPNWQTINMCHVVAKFAANASGTTWWTNLQPMQVVPQGGQICNLCKWCQQFGDFFFKISWHIFSWNLVVDSQLKSGGRFLVEIRWELLETVLYWSRLRSPPATTQDTHIGTLVENSFFQQNGGQQGTITTMVPLVEHVCTRRGVKCPTHPSTKKIFIIITAVVTSFEEILQYMFKSC